MWPFKKRGVKRLEIQRTVEKEVTESDKFLRIISEVISNFDREKQVHFNVLILKDNPRPVDVRKISGSENYYRVRAGDYRIIY